MSDSSVGVDPHRRKGRPGRSGDVPLRHSLLQTGREGLRGQRGSLVRGVVVGGRRSVGWSGVALLHVTWHHRRGRRPPVVRQRSV